VTLTILTLDTYMSNFSEIEETFCGRTDRHLRPTLLGQLRRVYLKTKGSSFVSSYDLWPGNGTGLFW